MKTININARAALYGLLAILALVALSACGQASAGSLGATQPQPTVTIPPGFQQQMSPIPTVPPYRCGAWASDNAPNPGETITIYARLTQKLQGVQGKAATAVVHFSSGDATLDQATSDQGGYVTFKVALNGRQPAKVPATVDVTFAGLAGGSVSCQAFFTPM